MAGHCQTVWVRGVGGGGHRENQVADFDIVGDRAGGTDADDRFYAEERAGNAERQDFVFIYVWFIAKFLAEW